MGVKELNVASAPARELKAALEDRFWRHALVHMGVKYSNAHGETLDAIVRALILRLPDEPLPAAPAMPAVRTTESKEAKISMRKATRKRAAKR